MERHRPFAIAATVAVAALLATCPASRADEAAALARAATGTTVDIPDTFRFAGPRDVDSLFTVTGYTPEAWQSGERTVPRFYLARVPSRWREQVAPELPVDQKKRVFFFAYAPLVLKANEDILADRAHLLDLLELREDGALTRGDRLWLRDLARRYRIELSATGPWPAETLARLRRRVDIVPPSLALAQAAVESGWSTSRFSDEGNALFGQWTWGEDGITPQQQRDGMGDYKIRAFPSPEASIAAYMNNLNTHPSYREFRRERERLRAAGEPLTGLDLAGTLTSYSEEGELYVEKLQGVIRVNRIEDVDATRLRDMTPVMLLPVGPGAD